MATLIELDGVGAIHWLDPVVEDWEDEWRSIFVSPRLRAWIETILPTLESSWVEETPAEQLDALISQFALGEPLTYSWHFKPLVHLADGIWELKTGDLRIFGWFPVKDTFIAVDADMKERIRDLAMYRPYCEQAARFREALPLNEPKFVPGDDPNAVVSDFSYP